MDDVEYFPVPESMAALKLPFSEAVRVVTRVTCPGRSMALTLAARSMKPWITSLLVITKVTSAPSGRRISGGLKNQIPASR